jgi:hydrogenase nickel incorporation protein HypB
MTKSGKQETPPAFRVITLEENIPGENENVAVQNRELLNVKGIYTLNLMSTPGAGKTTLLVETLNALLGTLRCAVIEGDQQTSHDASRVALTGVPVVQINTRAACHLDAFLVHQALAALPIDEIDLLFIENVGNLICPAEYDLGENQKIVLMSITEGEDKPVKYPLMFHLADALILTKIDLLPYLRFDLELCKGYFRAVNPDARIIETSVYNRQGLEQWIEYLSTSRMAWKKQQEEPHIPR